MLKQAGPASTAMGSSLLDKDSALKVVHQWIVNGRVQEFGWNGL